MPEIFDVNLDEELLSHLPDEESWSALRAEGFHSTLVEDEDVREIFEWAESYYREHRIIATASVLADHWDLDLTDPETAIGYLIEQMRLRYMRNEGYEALKEVEREFKKDPLTLPGKLSSVQREISAIVSKRGEMFGSGEFDRAMTLYEKHENDGPGPGFGFPTLNDYFYGQRGLTVILGAPKTWKSWMMCQGTLENIEEGGFPYYYSLEMPSEEVTFRLHCLASDLEFWKYTRKDLNKKDKARLQEASELLDGCGVFKVNKPPAGERTLDHLVTKAGEAGATVVYIDQLQYVEVGGRSLGDWNETGRYFAVLNQARDLSDEIPICIAHQFNKTVEYAQSMPSYHSAKGSNAIPETATVCLGLWTLPEMRDHRRFQIGTLVSRHTELPVWEAQFDLTQRCRFEILGLAEKTDE